MHVAELQTRSIRWLFSSLEPENGRTLARGTTDSTPGSRRVTPYPGMSADGAIRRCPDGRVAAALGQSFTFTYGRVAAVRTLRCRSAVVIRWT